MSTIQNDEKKGQSLSFDDKEIRKYKKKVREAEQKFIQTQDKKYLTARDEHQDKVIQLEKNKKVNLKVQKIKKMKEQIKKTDNQFLNEAMKQKRRDKNELQKIIHQKQKEKDEKMKKSIELRKQMKKNQEEVLQKVEEHKQKIEEIKKHTEIERKKFIDQYLKENPNSNQSVAQKEYISFEKQKFEFLDQRRKLVQHMMSQGMSEEQALQQFNQALAKMKEDIESDESE
jgi:hypothetical protein